MRHRRRSRTSLVVLGIPAVLVLLLLLPATRLLADDTVEVASEDALRNALDRFENELGATEEPGARADAIRRLGTIDHPKVASRLLQMASSEDDADIRAAALDALSRQTSSANRIGSAVARLFASECKAKTRKRIEVPVLRGTTIVDDQSSEGKAAIAALRSRDRMRASMIRCLVALDYRRGIDYREIETFLRSGTDELVVAILELYGAFEVWSALPRILELHTCYPDESKWDTLSGTCLARDSARVTLEVNGDPELLRPRPLVVKAVRAAVKAITGREIRDVFELHALLEDPETKANIKRDKLLRR